MTKTTGAGAQIKEIALQLAVDNEGFTQKHEAFSEFKASRVSKVLSLMLYAKELYRAKGVGRTVVYFGTQAAAEPFKIEKESIKKINRSRRRICEMQQAAEKRNNILAIANKLKNNVDGFGPKNLEFTNAGYQTNVVTKYLNILVVNGELFKINTRVRSIRYFNTAISANTFLSNRKAHGIEKHKVNTFPCVALRGSISGMENTKINVCTSFSSQFAGFTSPLDAARHPPYRRA